MCPIIYDPKFYSSNWREKLNVVERKKIICSSGFIASFLKAMLFNNKCRTDGNILSVRTRSSYGPHAFLTCLMVSRHERQTPPSSSLLHVCRWKNVRMSRGAKSSFYSLSLNRFVFYSATSFLALMPFSFCCSPEMTQHQIREWLSPLHSRLAESTTGSAPCGLLVARLGSALSPPERCLHKLLPTGCSF